MLPKAGVSKVTTRLYLTAVVFCCISAVPSLAAYRLSTGDTLEFNAAGASELKHRAAIGIDGDITLPLIGAVPAAGLTLAELRSSVQKAFAQRVYRRSGPDGHEQPIIVSPDEITLTVSEYRPVIMNGDVSKPGEQTFRPSMTVRQAVAQAGGYDFVRFRMSNPVLEQADLRSQYETLWLEFAKGQSLLARLKAELASQTSLDRDEHIETPLSRETTARLEQGETSQLELRNSLHSGEKTFLGQAIQKEANRIALLSKQQANERAGADADTEEVSRLEGLFSKGAVPITRVVDARRAMLLSSTRVLQTISEQARMERERDAMTHKLAQLDDKRRLDLLHDIQDAEVALAVTRAKLQTTGEKLAYAGMLRSQLVNGKGATPTITVFRTVDGRREAVPGDEETELMPGDIVEVALTQYRPPLSSQPIETPPAESPAEPRISGR
jgi:polysaccharide export outer membrane protein